MDTKCGPSQRAWHGIKTYVTPWQFAKESVCKMGHGYGGNVSKKQHTPVDDDSEQLLPGEKAPKVQKKSRQPVAPAAGFRGEGREKSC